MAEQTQTEVPPVSATRAEFTAAILADAIAAQTSADNTEYDVDLEEWVDEIRAAKEAEHPLQAFFLATHLRGWLVAAGYYTDAQLPVWGRKVA